MEAVIPLEVSIPTIRTEAFAEPSNGIAITRDHDLAEERREASRVTIAAYQQDAARNFSKSVLQRTFKPGDLVLKKVVGNKKKASDGKLGPNWEGPYRVIKTVGIGAYRLENLDGTAVPRPWNSTNLTMYYH